MVVDLAITQNTTGDLASIYCVHRHEPALKDYAESCGVSVRTLNKPPGFSWRILLGMVRQLRADRPDVVHTHNELVHPYGTIAGRLAGVPVIANTLHGSKNKQDSHLHRNFNAVLPWTDAIVTVSEQTRRQLDFENAGQLRKTHTVRNGIPVDRFAAKTASPGKRWPAIKFGTVGRLAEVKDQLTMIRAIASVRERFESVELHILGDGPVRGDLEALVSSLRLQTIVTFHGASSNVPEFLQSLDVFVLSSLSEGLPMSVLEAMAAGLPIVSTRVGGTAEVAPEGLTAAYCEPGNPELLAAAMLSILEPVRLRDMGHAAQRIACASLTVEAMWRDYRKLFQTLLVPRRRSLVWNLLPA